MKCLFIPTATSYLGLVTLANWLASKHTATIDELSDSVPVTYVPARNTFRVAGVSDPVTYQRAAA